MSLLVLKSTISVPQSIVCLGLRRSCRHNFLLRVLATRLRILDACLPKHESAPVTMLQNNSNPLISAYRQHSKAAAPEQLGPKATSEARYLKSDTSSIHQVPTRHRQARIGKRTWIDKGTHRCGARGWRRCRPVTKPSR